MKVIAKTRLKIRDQNELLNQIAGTYKDFFRAAMEYIDNAVDAAANLREKGNKFNPEIKIVIDTKEKKVSLIDNCGGMSPKELCNLLSSVGRSVKKTVPWANGQFGFGVHAFRAFAKEALFFSKKGQIESMISIDRTSDENTDVACLQSDGKELEKAGTKVVISQFDSHVFKKSSFFNSVISEIEHHFDDVIRAKLIKIYVIEDNTRLYECKFFDYESLAGVPFKKEVTLSINGNEKKINVDLKILEKVQESRHPVITNKQRRVQNLNDLKSYKQFVRKNKGRDISLWSNPFIVGCIEINDLCSPNLTRDDLKDSPAREVLYEKIFNIQHEIETLIDEIMNKKTQDSYNKLGSVMSDCLSRIMRRFKLQFEQLAPSGINGKFEKKILEEVGDVPFGGTEEGGDKGNPKDRGNGKNTSGGGSNVGKGESGGGNNTKSKSSGEGLSKEQTIQSSGPKIEFQNHAGEDRIIDLGNSLIINTQHPDFIKRNSSKSGKIKLDTRLLNYVSLVITPPCVHRLFEKKGRVPTALEVGANILDLSLKLEHDLVGTVLGEEIENTIGEE